MTFYIIKDLFKIIIKTKSEIIYNAIQEVLDLGIKLNFFSSKEDNYYLLHNNILSFTNEGIALNKFWSYYLCGENGVNKRDFVKIQILVYELREIYEAGLININIYYGDKEYEFNLDKVKDRIGTTKDMIKQYKREFKTESKGCNITKKFEDGYIKICCVCGNKDILLFRRKQ